MTTGAKHAAQATATEVLSALVCFVAAVLFVLAFPGVASGLRWLVEAAFGRPELAPDRVRAASSLVLTPIATLLAAVLYSRLGRLTLPESPPVRPPCDRPGPLAAAGLTGVHLAAAVLGSAGLALLMNLLGAPVAEQALVLELVAAGGPALASLALSALVLAPLGEEWFFRGLLFRRLLGEAGPWSAYASSALLFAVFHGNIHGLVIYLWLGLVFASAYATTGRLGCAVAVHFGNNALTLATLAAADV